MRFVRFRESNGQISQGSLCDNTISCLDAGLQPTGESVALADVSLLAPVIPSNIFCIGLNYREHAKESGLAIPEQPVVFMKPTSTLLDPGEPIPIPACSDPQGEVDYECELAVVIGRAARNVSKEDALDYVRGYTAANDVSARKWQTVVGGQWIRGKSFDGFCPLGPTLVTADEIPDPQVLGIRTTLNGQVVQEHTTGDMIFTVAELISFLSQDTTLLPDTVILTGTPQGVGFARKPPIWLKPGDKVVVELEKIGQLINPVKAADALT